MRSELEGRKQSRRAERADDGRVAGEDGGEQLKRGERGDRDREELGGEDRGKLKEETQETEELGGGDGGGEVEEQMQEEWEEET